MKGPGHRTHRMAKSAHASAAARLQLWLLYAPCAAHQLRCYTHFKPNHAGRLAAVAHSGHTGWPAKKWRCKPRRPLNIQLVKCSVRRPPPTQQCRTGFKLLKVSLIATPETCNIPVTSGCGSCRPCPGPWGCASSRPCRCRRSCCCRRCCPCRTRRCRRGCLLQEGLGRNRGRRPAAAAAPGWPRAARCGRRRPPAASPPAAPPALHRTRSCTEGLAMSYVPRPPSTSVEPSRRAALPWFHPLQ